MRRSSAWTNSDTESPMRNSDASIKTDFSSLSHKMSDNKRVYDKSRRPATTGSGSVSRGTNRTASSRGSSCRDAEPTGRQSTDSDDSHMWPDKVVVVLPPCRPRHMASPAQDDDTGDELDWDASYMPVRRESDYGLNQDVELPIPLFNEWSSSQA